MSKSSPAHCWMSIVDRRVGEDVSSDHFPVIIDFTIEPVTVKGQWKMIVPIDPNDPILSAFTAEVPEIAEGTVEIKGIAREAGNRAKVAVTSNRPDVDPVQACVGENGERIWRIVQQRMAGEKVDIVCWSDDPECFIRNTLLGDWHFRIISLNHVDRQARLVLEAGHRGRFGCLNEINIRLAAKLTGWDLIITEDAEPAG